MKTKALDRLWNGGCAWDAPLELRLSHADDEKTRIVWLLEKRQKKTSPPLPALTPATTDIA